MKNLFLDDIRIPLVVEKYIQPVSLSKYYREEEWNIVRNYDEFKRFIDENKNIDIISFDHDLADEHYRNYISICNSGNVENLGIDYSDFKEKTGYECLKYYLEKVQEENRELAKIVIHSMNSIGCSNMLNYLRNWIINIKKEENWEKYLLM